MRMLAEGFPETPSLPLFQVPGIVVVQPVVPPDPVALFPSNDKS